MIGAIATGMATGAIATLVMDALNLVAARAGLALPISHRAIGRVTGGWLRGRFTHPGPATVPPFRGDLIWGIAAHYLIGGVLGAIFLAGGEVLTGGAVSPVWAVGYGVATTVFAWFAMFPSQGLGLFGLRSPHGLKLPISSLLNHLLYGVGLAGAIALLPD